MADITTDVLIIGTGPAGSATAALLSTYGIENMAVNRYRWLANTPRAHITNQRTMEVLRDLGRDVEDEAYLHATEQELMGENVFCESLAGEEIGRKNSWGTHPNSKAEHQANDAARKQQERADPEYAEQERLRNKEAKRKERDSKRLRTEVEFHRNELKAESELSSTWLSDEDRDEFRTFMAQRRAVGSGCARHSWPSATTGSLLLHQPPPLVKVFAFPGRHGRACITRCSRSPLFK